MRIKIRELKQQLNTEIQLMDRKSSECRQWLSRFSVFDLQSYELQGEAYTALTSRIHSHSEFLRSQSLLFDAVKKGDRKNLAALGELRPTEPDGSVDTGHLEQLISDMQSRASHLEDMRGRARSLSKSAEGNAAADSLAEATEHLNAVCEAAARGYRDALDRVHRYINISSTFYADVQNLIPVISQASAAARATAEGRDADMAWTEAVDNQWGVAVQSEMKKYMTGEEWEAYKKAVADGWQASDFYRAGKGEKDPAKNNKALWKGLAKLPSWLLTSGMAAAAVKAMENMANGKYTEFNPDIKSLQEAVRFLFVSNGKSTAYGGTRLFGYNKSALLSRMIGIEDLYLNDTVMVGTNKTGNAHDPWIGRAMVNNLLHLVNRIKPTTISPDQERYDTSIWGSIKEFTINVGLAYPPKGNGSSARMVVISVEPNMYTVVACNTGQEGIGSSVPQTYVGMSGGMADVINLAGHMQNLGGDNKDDNKGFRDWIFQNAFKNVAIESGTNEALSILVGLIPQPAGGALSALLLIQSFSSDVMEEYENRMRAANSEKIMDAQLFFDGNPIFRDMGVIFNYDNVRGERGENYADPKTRMLMNAKERSNIKRAIAAYNAVNPNAHYSFEIFMRDIAGNSLDANDPSIKSKVHATADFIKWCEVEPNLVYKRDVVDSDGVVHHKGDKVVLENPPSNFGYIKGADMEYKDYMFAPGQGE